MISLTTPLLLLIIFIVIIIVSLIIFIVFILHNKPSNMVGLTKSVSTNNFPSSIMFIRHGEKPKKGADLNATGEVHANCWKEFFINNRPSTINLPQSIYAMKNSEKGKNSSNRPYETILPLAQQLNITPNNNYIRDDYSGVISNILQNNSGKTVLVCWEHSAIVDLVNELINEVYGQNGNCGLNIKSWGDNPTKKGNEGDNFSSLWKITFENNKINFYVYPGCAVDSKNNCDFNPKTNVTKIDTYNCSNTF